MVWATISADIVKSTSLAEEDWMDLTDKIKELLSKLESSSLIKWGRLVKGDSIECVLENPKNALRIAILLKSFIKAYSPSHGEVNKKFKNIGLRLAIGIGGMRIVDKDKDLMDGEAIYLSGRKLIAMGDDSQNMQVVMESNEENKALPVITSLLNYILDKATRRQCETLYCRLLRENDEDVAKYMKITRSGVYQNLKGIGWDAIKSAMRYFENLNFN